MGNWTQILVIAFVIFGPLISRIVQEIGKKRAQQRSLDKQERDMLTGRNVRRSVGSQQQEPPPAQVRRSVPTVGLSPEERAAQRQARLDEWRAAESKYRVRAGQMPRTTGRTGTPPPFVVSEGEVIPLSADADEAIWVRLQQAIERMRTEQQRIQQQRQRQRQQSLQQRQSQRSPSPQTGRVMARPPQQRQTHAGTVCPEPETPGESVVHRLVKADELGAIEATAAAGRIGSGLKKPRVIPAGPGVGGSIMLTRQSLRQAFILKEVLEPPLALRDRDHLTGG